MKKPWLYLAVGAAVIALVGTGVVAWAAQPEKTVAPAPNTAASTISVDELANAADQRLFFGHMSVGENVLSGVSDVYATRNAAEPKIVEIERGQAAPRAEAGRGIFVHSLIGRNRHPQEKLANFDATLRGGLAEQVDVALVKFCYVDISWYTDVDALFETYQSTLDALQRDYPNVTFLHVTTPLTTPPSGIKERVKALVGRDDNVARERFNAKMRASYGADRLFDLAAVESTAPDGSTAASLYPGYSSDGAHLNASGSSAAAVQFLKLLAQTKQP